MDRIRFAGDGEERRDVIKVIGLGGAGGNAVDRMVEAGLRDAELVAANTDVQVLRKSKAHFRIQLGEQLVKGKGVGGDPAKGRLAAEESIGRVREVLAGSDLVFITAGMGGGTGTGAAPVVAKVSRELRALTIGVVTRPFGYEGTDRADIADAAIQELRGLVDTLLVIPNDNVFGVIDEKTPSAEAYRRVDDVLRQAVQSISDLIAVPGEINVDLNDLRRLMEGAGEAHIGIGEEGGHNRHMDAARQAVTSKLLENVSIDGARGLLVNFTSDRKILTQAEIKQAMDFINSKVSPDARTKWGQTDDPTLGDRLRITVIATRFDARKLRQGHRRRTVIPPDWPIPPDPRAPGQGAPARGADGVDWNKPAFRHWKPRRLI